MGPFCQCSFVDLRQGPALTEACASESVCDELLLVTNKSVSISAWIGYVRRDSSVCFSGRGPGFRIHLKVVIGSGAGPGESEAETVRRCSAHFKTQSIRSAAGFKLAGSGTDAVEPNRRLGRGSDRLLAVL